jgi:hypothetical protein
MRTNSNTNAKATATPWIMLLGILLIYLCFPTRNYYWDGIAFAQAIEDAARFVPSLIHPNHLIYNLVGYAFYTSLRSFGLDLRALTALQILNSLLSALAAYVLFLILKSSLRSRYLCYVLTLLFAFSATWWKYSTDADAYVPSVLFLLISFYLILPTQKARPILVAVTYSLSMCFHQLAFLFGPVLLLGLFLQSASLSRRQRIVNLIFFSCAAFVLTFAAYYLCFYLASGSLDFKRWVRWITSYSPDATFTFNLWSNFSYTLRGHTRLFFNGRFNLIKGLTNPLIVTLLAALTIVNVVLGFKVIRNLRKPSFQWLLALRNDRERRPLLLLCLLWIGVYLIFLFFWLPQNTFYRLFYLPALILLAGFVLDPQESAPSHSHKYRLALFATSMVLCNFIFFIYPYTHAEKYPPLSLALEMNQAWPQGTVIYYGAANSDNSLVRYFNSRTTWKPLPTDSRVLESELRDVYTRGATAWLDASAIDQLAANPEGAEWLRQHGREATRHALVNKAYNLRFIQVVPNDQ